MRLVIIESPFAARWWWGRWFNRRYARRCMRHALLAGDAPLASHLLYTQSGILRDDIPAERKCGIEAGLAWGTFAEKTLVYIDRGVSGGMLQGIDAALAAGRLIEFRSLGKMDLDTRQNIARAMDECGVRPSGDGMVRAVPGERLRAACDAQRRRAL